MILLPLFKKIQFQISSHFNNLERIFFSLKKKTSADAVKCKHLEISGEPKQCSARPHRALNMGKKLFFFSKKCNLPQRLKLMSHLFGTVCTLVLNKMNWNKSLAQNFKVQIYLDITSLKMIFKPNEHYKRRERKEVEILHFF